MGRGQGKGQAAFANGVQRMDTAIGTACNQRCWRGSAPNTRVSRRSATTRRYTVARRQQKRSPPPTRVARLGRKGSAPASASCDNAGAISRTGAPSSEEQNTSARQVILQYVVTPDWPGAERDKHEFPCPSPVPPRPLLWWQAVAEAPRRRTTQGLHPRGPWRVRYRHRQT